MVHFILTAGEMTWQYRRALESAKVHEEEVVLWYVGDEPEVECETSRIVIPSWLRDQHPAHVYDVLALETLYLYGGMSFGLDTISLRPAGDLLEKELTVGIDVPFVGYENPDVGGGPVEHPFNNHLLAVERSEIVLAMYREARRRVESGRLEWGATGPRLLTKHVLDNPDRVDIAPFPTLCGWEGSYIWRFYQGLEEPDESVRVIHLYSSAYPSEYASFDYVQAG